MIQLLLIRSCWFAGPQLPISTLGPINGVLHCNLQHLFPEALHAIFDKLQLDHLLRLAYASTDMLVAMNRNGYQAIK